MRNKNLIVFDMDGVIIDVSESYRDTVRQTVRIFFQDAPAFKKLPDPFFSLQDLATVKQSGGLNNDWELTYLVLSLLMARVDIPEKFQDDDPWILHERVMKSCDLTGLRVFLSADDAPLKRLLQENGKENSAFIRHLSSDEVGSGNIIKQMFQEIYLGRDLFESTYGIPARVHKGEGLINREKLLIPSDVLSGIAKNNILAIATGRPKAEADYPLERFGIEKYFSSILSLDDCLREEKAVFEKEKKRVSLSKPNPYMLDAIAQIHSHEVSRCFYLGDMPDDIMAASRSGAGFTGVGVVLSAPNKADLKQALVDAGAQMIIEEMEGLKSLSL